MSCSWDCPLDVEYDGDDNEGCTNVFTVLETRINEHGDSGARFFGVDE